MGIVGVALAALIGCGTAVGVAEGVRYILRRRAVRIEAEAQAADAQVRTDLFAHAQQFALGALAGVRATAGAMTPARVEEVREALKRAGIAEGVPVSAYLVEGRPLYVAVPRRMEVEWSEQAESVAVSFHMQVEPAEPLQREKV